MQQVTHEKIKLYVTGLNNYFVQFNKNPIFQHQYEGFFGKEVIPTKVLYCWLLSNKDLTPARVHDMWALSLFVDISVVAQNGAFKARWKKRARAPSLPTVFFKENKEGGDPYAGDIIYWPGSNGEPWRAVVGNKAQYAFPMPSGKGSIALDGRRISQLIPYYDLSRPCKKQDVDVYHSLKP